MNAFKTLSLPSSLTLTEDGIKEAYEKSSGGEKELTARNTLLSPVERLSEWMKEAEIPLAKHAALPAQILPLFSEMAVVIEKVSALSRKKEESQSVLAETLILKELLQEKEGLDSLSGKIKELEEETLLSFPTLEKNPSSEEANNLLQSLKFIKKWKAELNQAYGKLF